MDSNNNNNQQQPLNFRQGDIVMMQVMMQDPKSMMKGLVKTKDQHILAHGELTGHVHAFHPGAQVELYAQTEEQEPTLMIVHQTSTLSHQEHKPYDIPAGIYEIKRESEFNPFTNQIQQVRD